MQRTGSASLPLHGGRVPAWLAKRMAVLGRLIVEALVIEYGRPEVLRRLSHPFWFQSFGAVMGMDWHSSGITTSVMGALKRGLAPVADDLGLWVCGGRGRHSRKTPTELTELAERTGLDGDRLVRTSRLTAKVDSAAIQDGHQIYLHSFVVAADGSWCVVQQGMRPDAGTARRYHWLSEGLESFVDAPHAAIEQQSGRPGRDTIINLTDRRAKPSRKAQLDVIARGPDRALETLRRVTAPHLHMPHHHDVRHSDVFMRRLRGTLAAASDAGPRDFSDLLLTPGVGARTVEALALVAEVVHGTPARFDDPGRFSYAHGGKDGHPFPVPLKVYDRTISVLRRAIDSASLEHRERLDALKRLDRQARALEATVSGDGPTWSELVMRERTRSPRYGGMSVFGPAQPQRDRASRKASKASAKQRPRRAASGRQLELF